MCPECQIKRAYQANLGSPSSRMTLSPKTLISMDPLALSTSRVRISLIAFERALMSIAHIPRTIVGFGISFPKYRSDVWDPVGDGVEDLARMELERGECLSPMCNKETREGLSQCIGTTRPASAVVRPCQVGPSCKHALIIVVEMTDTRPV